MTTFNMVAPSPGQTFTGNPSGSSYTADSNAGVSGVMPNDVLAMLKDGCKFAPAAMSGSSGSQLILTLSQAGIASDATNGIDYGATAPSGSTGQEAAIQTAINNAVTQAAALGVTGVKVIWDVAVALGQEIYLTSNTTIEAPHYGCGAIMRANSQCPIFRVKGSELNMGGGAYTGAYVQNTQNTFGKFDSAHSGSANPQYYRVFDPAYVNANNIEIVGGTWNANSPQQPAPTAGVPFLNAARNIGWVTAMQFFGVNGLRISKSRIFLGVQFGVYILNAVNVILDSLDIDNHNGAYFDNDAIHFNGPSNNIRIYSPRTHCGDDEIAFNADDANGPNFSTGLTPGANWACSGAIYNAHVYDWTIWYGRENVAPYGGLSLRSTVARIDDIVINGLYGSTSFWGLWAPNYYKSGASSMLIPGSGNIGHVLLENINIDVSGNNNIANISASLNIEHLQIRSRYRLNPQNYPDIFIAPGSTVGKLEITDYAVQHTAGSNNNAIPAVVVAGTVGTLRFTGSVVKDSSLSVTDAPLVQVNTYTAGSNQSFPFSGTGSIDVLDINADVMSSLNLVKVSAGTIGTLKTAGIHRNAGGGSPLANSGTVKNFIVGTGAYPLAYAASTSYTGTAPSNINAYAESGAMTLETPAIAVAGASMILQGTYTGGVPTSGTVSFNSATAVAMTGFTASAGYWYGTATAPASASNNNTVAVTHNTGATASSPSSFLTLGTSGTILNRAQFIPGTTGFATTLGSYTGSSNGDTGNAWSITATGGSTTPIQPTIASAGGGLTHTALYQGSYYHNVTNLGSGVHPVVASGWKIEMTDVLVDLATAANIVLQLYSDAAQNNCFQIALNNSSVGFSNVSSGTTTNVQSNTTVSGLFSTTSPTTYEVVNDGTTISVLKNGTSVATCPASGINASLVSNTNCTYFGWTAFSGNSTPLTYTLTSVSFGY